MNEKKYDETISPSKQASLIKAIEIFDEEQINKERIIIRPNINSKKEIISIFLKTVIFVLLILLIIRILIIANSIYLFAIGMIVMLFYLLLTLKKSLISLILLYQKHAPESLRKSCLFEPSCSEYMLLAINKYGLFKGVIKGIKRLIRCHQPNGGKDYP